MVAILPIILSYLIGSIPFSFVVAKMKGVNLKEKVKNGQIGAAAVKRNCGLLAAVLAGSGDFSKGVLAVFIAKKLTNQEWIVLLSGLGAIIGHNWSIFLKFWGGKGALVTFGILFYLLPLSVLCSIPLVIPFLLIRKREIFRIKKASFFTGLGYVLISMVSFAFQYSLIFSISPLIFAFPMIFKKNY
jgi:glycerol-3-phosphate acyltransferase PlsY